MKRKRWSLILWAVLLAAVFGSVSPELLAGVRTASSSGNTSLETLADRIAASSSVHAAEEEVELTYQKKFSGGLALYSTTQKFRTMSMGSFSGSYGEQLSGLSRTIYDEMVGYYVTKSGTGELLVSVNLSFKVPEDIGNIYESEGYQKVNTELEYAIVSAFGALLYDYPELYWAECVYLDYGNGGAVWVPSTGEGKISKVRISMGEIYSGAKNEQSQFNSAVSQAAAAITGGTTYDKIKSIHDYLCRLITYPSTYNMETAPKPVYHSAAGVFLNGGVAVCEGYAKAFRILCKKIGVNAILVVGDAGGAHMWNYVQLEGRWYAVDVTWDDVPYGDPRDEYFLIGSNTPVSGGTFGATRVLNTYFTETTNSKRFTYPVLNGERYVPNSAAHTHSWTLVSETKPTCTEAGEAKYRCTACGEVSYDQEAALGHSFQYVYNNDATALKDGTKTLVCENCGMKKGGKVTAKGTKLKATIKVNVSSLLLRKGQTTTVLKVSGLAKGDAVKSWKSSNTKVVKVTKSGKVTAQKWSGKKAKTAWLTVTLKSGLQKKAVKVTVQDGTVRTTKISGVAKTLTLKKGKTKKLAPVLKPITSQQKVTYTSSNKKIVSVSSSGKLTAKKKGKATITVKSGTKTVKCKVTVK